MSSIVTRKVQGPHLDLDASNTGRDEREEVWTCEKGEAIVNYEHHVITRFGHCSFSVTKHGADTVFISAEQVKEQYKKLYEAAVVVLPEYFLARLEQNKEEYLERYKKIITNRSTLKIWGKAEGEGVLRGGARLTVNVTVEVTDIGTEIEKLNLFNGYSLTNAKRMVTNGTHRLSITKTIALISSINRYVCAEHEGDDELIANREINKPGPWEKFEVVKQGRDVLSLKAVNGLFVCAESAGRKPLIANRAAAHSWEKFEIIKHDKHSVSGRPIISLKAVNGLFVSRSSGLPNRPNPLIADRIKMGPWEEFSVEMVGGESLDFEVLQAPTTYTNAELSKVSKSDLEVPKV